MELLFSEELGLVLEVSQSDVDTVSQRFSKAGVQCHIIGRTQGFGPEAIVRHQPQHASETLICDDITYYISSFSISITLYFKVRVRVDGQELLNEPLPDLRAVWEDTSFQMERLQANELCVKQEEEGLAKMTQPYFKLTFDPTEMPNTSKLSKTKQDESHLQ